MSVVGQITMFVNALIMIQQHNRDSLSINIMAMEVPELGVMAMVVVEVSEDITNSRGMGSPTLQLCLGNSQKVL